MLWGVEREVWVEKFDVVEAGGEGGDDVASRHAASRLNAVLCGGVGGGVGFGCGINLSS